MTFLIGVDPCTNQRALSDNLLVGAVAQDERIVEPFPYLTSHLVHTQAEQLVFAREHEVDGRARCLLKALNLALKLFPFRFCLGHHGQLFGIADYNYTMLTLQIAL